MSPVLWLMIESSVLASSRGGRWSARHACCWDQGTMPTSGPDGLPAWRGTRVCGRQGHGSRSVRHPPNDTRFTRRLPEEGDRLDVLGAEALWIGSACRVKG